MENAQALVATEAPKAIDPYPARSAIQVSTLPSGSTIEAEAVVHII